MGEESVRGKNFTWVVLDEIANAYRYAMYSPSRAGVHFGCDCGCGGDSYTSEEWDEEERLADEAIAAAKEFCEKNGITYDGIE